MKQRKNRQSLFPEKDAEFSAGLTPDLSDGHHSLPHPARMLAARMDHIPGARPETEEKSAADD